MYINTNMVVPNVRGRLKIPKHFQTAFFMPILYILFAVCFYSRPFVSFFYE